MIRTYGANGGLIARKGGYDELRQEFNEQGRLVWMAYYLGGEPFTMAGGYAAVERECDDARNVIREKYYDADDNPVTDKNGYEEIRREYNEKKQVALYFEVGKEYDDNGLAISENFFDCFGYPTTCREGYKKVQWEFNEKKKVSRESYYRIDGTLVTNANGEYRTAFEYDEKSRAVKEAYLDENEEPMIRAGGYLSVKLEHDKKENKVSGTEVFIEEEAVKEKGATFDYED